MEEWKVIEEFPNYWISNHGRVKNKKGLILKLRYSNKRYLRCSFRYLCTTPVSRTIHRLVAITFISNPNNKPHVNHIDGNKNNNYASNLEWCTHQENIRHSYIIGTHKNTDEQNYQAIEARALCGMFQYSYVSLFFNKGNGWCQQVMVGKLFPILPLNASGIKNTNKIIIQDKKILFNEKIMLAIEARALKGSFRHKFIANLLNRSVGWVEGVCSGRTFSYMPINKKGRLISNVKVFP